MLDLILAAEAAANAGEPTLSPYAVGGIALGILLLLLLITVLFGLGREHS